MTNPVQMPDLNKLFEQFNMPGVDVKAMLDARRKDFEALAQANKTVFDAAVQTSQKQMQAYQEMMQEAAKNVAQFSAQPDLQKAQAMAKAAYEKSLGNARELAELARSTQTEALATLSKRAQENMQEFQKLFKPK